MSLVHSPYYTGVPASANGGQTLGWILVISPNKVGWQAGGLDTLQSCVPYVGLNLVLKDSTHRTGMSKFVETQFFFFCELVLTGDDSPGDIFSGRSVCVSQELGGVAQSPSHL